MGNDIVSAPASVTAAAAAAAVTGSHAPPSGHGAASERTADATRAAAAVSTADRQLSASRSEAGVDQAVRRAEAALASAVRMHASPAAVRQLEAQVERLRGRAEETKRDIVVDDWVANYRARTDGDREIVEIAMNGFDYLYDSTPSPAADQADNRLVAVHGRSASSHGPRDSYRMSHHPNPNHVDRGHVVARTIGGGYDLNLIPQDPKLNRGHSEPGKVWRELETDLERRPGTEFFVRPAYGDNTDYPTHLEFGVRQENGEWRVEEFDNRPDPAEGR